MRLLKRNRGRANVAKRCGKTGFVVARTASGRAADRRPVIEGAAFGEGKELPEGLGAAIARGLSQRRRDRAVVAAMQRAEGSGTRTLHGVTSIDGNDALLA